MVAEMAAYLHEKHSLNLSGYLTSLYAKYGSFATENRYFFCYDPILMKKIFDTFRLMKVFHIPFPADCFSPERRMLAPTPHQLAALR